MTDDSQGGLRGDPVDGSGQGDGTRDQMCNKISELEAARDHLRARLREQIQQWEADAVLRQGDITKALTGDISTYGHFRFGEALKRCAADLLAVLTEPPQHEKKDEHAHTEPVR